MFEREGKRERVVDGERSIVDLELVPRTPRDRQENGRVYRYELLVNRETRCRMNYKRDGSRSLRHAAPADEMR